MSYASLDELLVLLEGANGQRMRALIDDHRDTHAHAAGSSGNHQAWPGGFWDHTTEVGNIALVQYEALSACRPLPFSLADALLVLFAHDLEKLLRYRDDGTTDPTLATKAAKIQARQKLLDRYGIQFTPEQANAQRFAEGVKDEDYRPDRRQMGPLATFVHTCDLLSARLWYAHPLPGNEDPWGPRRFPETTERVADEVFDEEGWSLGAG